MKLDLNCLHLNHLNNKCFLGTILAFALISSTEVNALGYVSRDCPGAGAKESISWDYTGTRWWLYTESIQLRKDRRGDYWETRTSGNTYEWTNRSYAGNWLDYLNNYYYAGVEGRHYRNLKDRRVIELRRTKVSNCNLMNWGLNNW